MTTQTTPAAPPLAPTTLQCLAREITGVVGGTEERVETVIALTLGLVTRWPDACADAYHGGTRRVFGVAATDERLVSYLDSLIARVEARRR